MKIVVQRRKGRKKTKKGVLCEGNFLQISLARWESVI